MKKMVYFKIYIFLLIVQLKIDYILSSTRFNLLNVDAELAETIKLVSPEFAKSLKRRFTNVGISAELRTAKLERPSITFEDVTFSEGSSQITLKNLVIERHPTARMNEIVPNLLEKNLQISVDWYNVILSGSYEMINTSQLLPLPIRNSGDIIITLETIKAKGLVGFALSRDALKTTNFDLNFTVDDVDITIEYFDNEAKSMTKSSTMKKNIDETFAKYLKRDLYWKLQETLRSRLNDVLLDFTVAEIFSDNIKMSEKYVERSLELDEFLNNIVDEFLKKAKNFIVSRGYSTLPIPNFKKDFSKRFGGITFWGAFEAKNGTVYDLSRVIRCSDFSFTFSDNILDDEIIIFGSLGLEELKLHYNRYYAHVWNIGPWGDLKASVGNNSLNFKIVATIRDIFKFDILFKQVDLKISQFENIKVDATGMSVILDWLLSHIMTWITGRFKQDIIGIIEKELTVYFNRILPKKY